MRALFVGDVVGPRAVAWLAGQLPALRSEHGVDLVVADAENCGPDGTSMTVAGVESLLEAGADVVTGGNHAFEGDEVEAVLGHERVLRPLNVGADVPGRGALTVTVGGEEVRVVVLADRLALADGPQFAHMALEPYAAWAALPAGPPTTIVEMHALSVAAKQSLAYALDGEVAAVLGTHTHEPTIALRVLPRGTALVTEVGMTGPRESLQGMDPQAFVDYVRGVPRERLSVRPADGEMVLGAVLVDIEEGLARGVRRL